MVKLRRVLVDQNLEKQSILNLCELHPHNHLRHVKAIEIRPKLLIHLVHVDVDLYLKNESISIDVK